jgi:hypothetical protein
MFLKISIAHNGHTSIATVPLAKNTALRKNQYISHRITIEDASPGAQLAAQLSATPRLIISLKENTYSKFRTNKKKNT